MIIIQRIATAIGILVFSLGLAHAANAQPLTPQQVERFIASMPETAALGDKHDDNKRRTIDPAQPLTSSLKLMDKQSPAYADLAQLASRHGFSSVEQWANVGDRTIAAYGIAASGVTTSEVEAGYQQGIANINKDPGLTAAKKEAILVGMKKGHQRNMNARQSVEPDLAAVRPHMTELGKLLE
ncbi:MAG: hypothetical protein KA735_05465 [Burkholderiaceae bacterium]|nr:hypothetical protein [Burkholderiaceae bacterium]